MGYLNEFPHFESNKLNLDWILEQYSTFNQRIKEIQDHFDEVAEQMQQGIDTFEESVNNSLAQMTQDITDLQGDFDTFVETVNQNFSDLTDDIRGDVDEAITDIQNQITAITNNMVTYISNHMEEWQAEASYNNNILKLSNEASPSLDDDESIYNIQLDGTLHSIGLSFSNARPTSFDTNVSNLSPDGSYSQSAISFDSSGLYLITGRIYYSHPDNTSGIIRIGHSLDTGATFGYITGGNDDIYYSGNENYLNTVWLVRVVKNPGVNTYFNFTFNDSNSWDDGGSILFDARAIRLGDA